MSSQLVGIADRYDRELAGVTDETLKRIFAAYDASYRNLVKNLREAFPRLEQAGSISTLVRQGAIAAELGEALKFIDPAAAKELESLGRDTIRQAGDLGQQMAGDTLNYVGMQSTFTTVPVGAVRNQAERFRERLVNYSDQQASSISAVVEQGLIQGWGTRKIEGQLRGLGVSFKSNAETVARTEAMSAYNGAARSRYEQAGVAYIQWIATPAEGTCSLCYARNTKVWKIAEAPSIPAHPRCRCATLPVSSLDQIDTAFYEAYSQDGLDDLARQKLAPDNGLTYWEKKAGATLAKPAWMPGQVISKKEKEPAPGYKGLVQRAEQKFAKELEAIDDAIAELDRQVKPLQKEQDKVNTELRSVNARIVNFQDKKKLSQEEELEYMDLLVERDSLWEKLFKIDKRIEGVQSNSKVIAGVEDLRQRLLTDSDQDQAQANARNVQLGSEEDLRPYGRSFYTAELEKLYAAVNNQVSGLDEVDLFADKDGNPIDRGFANPRIPGVYPGQINVGQHETAAGQLRALWHEFGHHLEFSSPAYKEAAVEWRQARAYSDRPVQMDGHKPGEVALPGRYIRKYVGRVYANGWTEVISVGLENFSNPRMLSDFYQQDREHFLLILGMLR